MANLASFTPTPFPSVGSATPFPSPTPTTTSPVGEPISISHIVAGVAIAAIAAAVVHYVGNEEQARERRNPLGMDAVLLELGTQIAARSIHEGIRIGTPALRSTARNLASIASNGLGVLRNWLGSTRPGAINPLRAEQIAVVPAAAELPANPAIHSVAIVDPEEARAEAGENALPAHAGAGRGIEPAPVAEADLAAQALEAEARFTAAANLFISNLDLRTITPENYSAFISTQLNDNFQVSVERMHEIFAERFDSIQGVYIPQFIDEMNDVATLDAEIERLAETTARRRAELLARDDVLSGPGRYDGLVDSAWSEYFIVAKQQTEALARLCHFLAGHGDILTDHESYMLSQLNPKHPRGTIELNAMQSGVKTMVFGRDSIDHASILRTASAMIGSEDLVSRFQATSEEVIRRFAVYSQLHSDRAEIAGDGVNPHDVTAAIPEGSALAAAAAIVPSAEARRQATFARRQEQIALIQRFQEGTQSEIYVPLLRTIGGV